MSDQVPLNDPFGGWIHWDEIPTLGIEQVRLLRGGAADLYGSSAIGGVVDVVPVRTDTAGLSTSLRFGRDDNAEGGREGSGRDDNAEGVKGEGAGRGDSFLVKADVGGATENSVDEDALVAGAVRRMAVLGAYSGLRTGGYIPTAPAFRGTVDVPANVHQESGRLVLSSSPWKRSVRDF